jgi:hypothetical protein
MKIEKTEGALRMYCFYVVAVVTGGNNRINKGSARDHQGEICGCRVVAKALDLQPHKQGVVAEWSRATLVFISL